MRKLLLCLLLLLPITHLQAQSSVVCLPAPVSAEVVLFSAPDAFGVVYTCYLTTAVTTPISEQAPVLLASEVTFVATGVPLPVESVPEDTERVCHRTTHPVGQRIAAYYSVPLSDVLALHCMGYGFGNINRAYATAVAERTSAAIVLVAERDGITWQEQANAQTSSADQSSNGNNDNGNGNNDNVNNDNGNGNNGNGNNDNGNGNNGNVNNDNGNGNGNNGNGNGNNGNGNGNNGNGNGNNGNGNGNNGNGNGNNGNGNGNNGNGNGNGNNGNGNGNNGNGNGNNGNGNGKGGK